MSQTVSNRITEEFAAKFAGSARLFERARGLFPNGVTHDSRYLEPFPIYIDRAAGSRKTDVDGNEMIDYWAGHGALLLGHSHPAVVEAVERQVGRSTHPGGCHELELAWGERVRQLVPSAERLRFTSSGTEATLMALRVARIATGRSKIVKFAGHFHGWHDTVSPANEPPHDVAEYRVPGVTAGVMQDVVIVPPNDLPALQRALDEHNPACVILEGNGGRWGVVPLSAEFVRGVREMTARQGVVFIHDEVITGFRVAPGGYQSLCDVRPDLSTFAKVLAGGLPGGCLAGRADLLDVLAFGNARGLKLKHPGTYNANPLSAAAGVAALDVVADGTPCRAANDFAAQLRRSLNELFQRKAVGWIAYGAYSTVKIHPEYDGPYSDSDDFVPYGGEFLKLDRSFDRALSHAFRCALLLEGVDWMGWGGNTCAVHADDDLERTVNAFDGAIGRLREDGLLNP